MRNIFKKPIEMDEQAELFIDYLSKTHDRFGLDTTYLTIFLQCKARKVRTMMELWNNYKYLNVTPTFKIMKARSNIVGDINLYRKIDMNSEHRAKTLLNAKLDMLEYIIKYHNTCKILGEVNNLNQMSLNDIMESEVE